MMLGRVFPLTGNILTRDSLAPLGALGLVIAFFSIASPGFLSLLTIQSAAVQLPELGLLTLAMLLPTLTGGLNLASTFTANVSGLAAAWVLMRFGGIDAGPVAFVIGSVAAVSVGAASGYSMGWIIARTKAHPILVSLSMMIFLRGLGEFLTRGADVSGFPAYVSEIGQGAILGIPNVLIVFVISLAAVHIILARMKLGFFTYLVGSNLEATRYSGVDTARTIQLVYMLSGVLSAVAGLVMLTRFNSVRVGHGESYLLLTILACFLGNVDPHGGFGRVAPVAIALLVLQLLSSGTNSMGSSQHLATAIWGFLLLAVMIGGRRARGR
ncbi:simple sugar transport system permease protein [Neorhizobium galegae]|uniref:ABC transporter permease n=1 Tax=Neorhizobium galegae TaxID=399 RepID=UPI0027831F92|nr:ABC transporter permease [Neorhizobium galegae]MDQ0138059.1 simple sugar transport system permease protein [Neorhizobium galegae]